MAGRRSIGIIAAGALALPLLLAPGAGAAGARPVGNAAVAQSVIGMSARGRAIRAYRIGRARRKVLVFGLIHGSESAGIAVTRRLRSVRPPRGVELLIVDDLNPDGYAAGSRQNARGVDLNRNFPFRWRPMGKLFSANFSGRAPASEPETKVAMRLVERIRPRVSVWYHQALGIVTRTGGDPVIEKA